VLCGAGPLFRCEEDEKAKSAAVQPPRQGRVWRHRRRRRV